MTKRITDLEEFCLSQVMRPYQTMLGYEERLERLPTSIEQIAAMLAVDCDWSRCVLDRINAIGFTFPSYINHPLVDVVKASKQKAPAD
jgi:hypothetical protein